MAAWGWREGEVERAIDTDGEQAVLSPTGDVLVSIPVQTNLATGSQAVDVWDWATGEHLRSLAGHSGAVTTAAFSPDGSRLATASTDGTVRVWDPRTGEEQHVLRGHDSSVGWVAFSLDGSRLASVGDGVVRLWALDLDELVELAESGLTRGLTDDECRQYLHVDRCPSP